VKRSSYAPTKTTKASKPFPGSYLGTLASGGSAVSSPPPSASTSTSSVQFNGPMATQHSSSTAGPYLESISPKSSSGRSTSYATTKSSGFQSSTGTGFSTGYLDSMSRVPATNRPMEQSLAAVPLGTSFPSTTALAANNGLLATTPYTHSIVSMSSRSMGSYLDAISGGSVVGSARTILSYAPTKPPANSAAAFSVIGSHLDHIATRDHGFAQVSSDPDTHTHCTVSSHMSSILTENSLMTRAEAPDPNPSFTSSDVSSPHRPYLHGISTGGSAMKPSWYAPNGVGWMPSGRTTTKPTSLSNGTKAPHCTTLSQKHSDLEANTFVDN
jgi:hypothetical protein